ncbi:MAG: macro domain-containing protein [Ignavibacteriaceae bacterium]|nr:macro domain-containing protein [Ignavibacteriaceae bacterium]
MFEFIKNGNLIEADSEALVNTVNTVGIMGKGVALQFKKAFPNNFKEYENAAKDSKIQIGKIFVTETGKFTNPKYIINFPTKKHWRYPSKIEWIREGLKDLKHFIINNNIKSIAIPPLGCGNGQLKWNDVRPLIINSLDNIVDLKVFLFEPSDYAYDNPSQKTRTKKPKLTAVRAMVIALLNQYTVLGYELTLLEAQKLVYFLQRFGEKLHLDFEKGKYGPYADKLTHVLNDMDGHYLSGMKGKTAQPFDKITIVSSEIEKIEEFISNNCTQEQKQRLESVYNLIEGFESPFGMELLATVDFVINTELNKDYNSAQLKDRISNWNGRKQKLMKNEFIEIAQKRLLSFSPFLYI